MRLNFLSENSVTDNNGNFRPESSTPTWFAGLRSKFADFNMTDWFTQLRLIAGRASPVGSRRHSEDRGRTTRLETSTRSVSVDPDPEPWLLPEFWINIDANSRETDDTLEMQHFGPLNKLLILGKAELGSGHFFDSVHLNSPTWCDKCGDFIWGMLRLAVRCKKCKYTCHYKCHLLVTLDCNNASVNCENEHFLENGKNEHLIAAENNEPFEQKDGALEVEEIYLKQDPFTWPNIYFGDKLKNMIQIYNETANGLGIAINEDGFRFAGYLQIHMNFTRPINVVAGRRPPSIFDLINTDNSASHLGTITSFFLPRNTVKTLHLNSETSCKMLIVALLRKYKVADNPRKFSLYERVYELGDGKNTCLRKLTRIPDDVHPLQLALSWGQANYRKQFVLQENDTGDILWEAFEIPELENFLRILDTEEQHYAWQIKQRFAIYGNRIDVEIGKKNGGGNSANPTNRTDILEGENPPISMGNFSDEDIFPKPSHFSQFPDAISSGNTLEFFREKDGTS